MEAYHIYATCSLSFREYHEPHGITPAEILNASQNRDSSLGRGWPVMVVDCGSALTFTAGNRHGRLAGGAILPGVRLQLAALGTRTAQLPSDVTLPEQLPPR